MELRGSIHWQRISEVSSASHNGAYGVVWQVSYQRCQRKVHFDRKAEFDGSGSGSDVNTASLAKPSDLRRRAKITGHFHSSGNFMFSVYQAKCGRSLRRRAFWPASSPTLLPRL